MRHPGFIALLSKSCLILLLTCFIGCTNAPDDPGSSGNYPIGPLEPVPAIQQRPEWNRFTILVWQWQNDVIEDRELYEKAGLFGFHIDRGKGKDDLVQFSLEHKFPYYVDHVAGKGILYLSPDLRPQVTGKRALLIRPRSLADPEVIAELKEQILANIQITKKGLVYAYAFDDEISLGSFNSPAEVDIHPLSIAWYRKWLEARYGQIRKLNETWDSNYGSFSEIQPVGFEDVRKSVSAPPIKNWNLSRWMEWRHFMDYQFAQVLAELTKYTNKLDPNIPAGFVGGQEPSAYGGYDYALLCRAVQWMEGSSDLLHSFWNKPRRPVVKTFHTTGSYKTDTWTLWKLLAHGDQATIAWPEGWFLGDISTGKRDLSDEIKSLSPVFREIQGSVSEFITNPGTSLETDPIGIYYSHPSIRVGWAMDSITHGRTWPDRSSSLDDDNLSAGWLRRSWCRLLEDLGYRSTFISYLDVKEKRIDLATQYKVIVLPRVICLSDTEAEALAAFVKSGGLLIADSLTGLLTETGRGRPSGALDDLFGIVRDESKGYLNGKSLTEIDAEYGDRPFTDRLRAYNDSLRHGSMVVYERGTDRTLARRRFGKGKAFYLNLTPLAYSYFPYRNGNMGKEFRDMIGQELESAGLYPRVTIDIPFVETLLWRNENGYLLAVVQNAEEMIQKGNQRIHVHFNLPATGTRNIRTGRVFSNPVFFTDSFNPWEAAFYSFNLTDP